MTLRRPSWFFRTMVLGAQGVFYNMFCAYFLAPCPLSPKLCLQSFPTSSARTRAIDSLRTSRRRPCTPSKRLPKFIKPHIPYADPPPAPSASSRSKPATSRNGTSRPVPSSHGRR